MPGMDSTLEVAAAPAERASGLGALHAWVVTVDHKRLGLMYVASGLLFFLIVAALEATAVSLPFTALTTANLPWALLFATVVCGWLADQVTLRLPERLDRPGLLVGALLAVSLFLGGARGVTPLGALLTLLPGGADGVDTFQTYFYLLLALYLYWRGTRLDTRDSGAIGALFAKLFAPRCSPHLSHLDEAGASALNVSCYMWWDLIPFLGRPDDPARREIDDACLGVMERTLDLDSIACRESALHGLGHWHGGYPRRVESAIDAFLGAHPDLRPELVRYARSARSGCVQ